MAWCVMCDFEDDYDFGYMYFEDDYNFGYMYFEDDSDFFGYEYF